jgi:hypothetical protein
MSALNTAINVLGTAATLKSLFGGTSTSSGKMNNFISEIRQNSVARTNLFEVMISIPTVMGSSSATAQKLSLYAEGAQLPGLNIQTDNIKRYGIGPMESVPYSIQNNDITVNFIGDGKGEVYKYFYNWMHSIVKGDSFITGGGSSSSGLAPYEVEFKEDYRSTLTISTFNEQGQNVLQYELYDAFPKNLPDVTLNWSDNSTMMQFGVTFGYMQAKLKNANSPLQVNQNGIGELSMLQKAIKIGTAVQAISSLRRPRNIQDILASSTTVKNVTRSFF